MQLQTAPFALLASSVMKKSHWNQTVPAIGVAPGALTEIILKHTRFLHGHAQSAAGPKNFARFMDKIWGVTYSAVHAVFIAVG